MKTAELVCYGLFIDFFAEMLDQVVTHLGHVAPKVDRQHAEHRAERVEDEVIGLRRAETEGELQKLDEKAEAESADGGDAKALCYAHSLGQYVGKRQSEGEKEEGVHEHHAPVLDLLERRDDRIEWDEHDLALCRRFARKGGIEHRNDRRDEQERIDRAPEPRAAPQLGEMPAQRAPQRDCKRHP